MLSNIKEKNLEKSKKYTLKKKKSNSKSKLPFIIGGISIGIFILFILIGCIFAFLNMN